MLRISLLMKSFLTLSLLLLLSIKASAQTGGIEGVVQDERGKSLRNAFVRIRDTKYGLKKNDTTDCAIVTGSDGRFVVELLESDIYDIEVSLKGYITELIEGVGFQRGQKTIINIFLTKPAPRRDEYHTLKEVAIHSLRSTRPLIEPWQPRSCGGNISDKEIEPMSSHSKVEEAQTLNSKQVQPKKLPEKHGIEWTDPGSRTILMDGE